MLRTAAAENVSFSRNYVKFSCLFYSVGLLFDIHFEVASVVFFREI